MLAPMIAMSRAARSSMRSTAAAFQVGLSHSTQLRRPCSMVSESKGRLAGFMAAPGSSISVFAYCWRPSAYEKEQRSNCKVKTRRATGDLRGKHLQHAQDAALTFRYASRADWILARFWLGNFAAG